MKKYILNREFIKDGDAVLFYGNGIISGIIRWADKAYYSHVGIAKWQDERLFIIDAWTNGVELVPMSRRMNIYSDFCVVRKKEIKEYTLKASFGVLFEKIERDQKYGYEGLWMRLLKLKLHIKTRFNSTFKEVCSDVACDFLITLGCSCYQPVQLPSPEDIKRRASTRRIKQQQSRR